MIIFNPDTKNGWRFLLPILQKQALMQIKGLRSISSSSLRNKAKRMMEFDTIVIITIIIEIMMIIVMIGMIIVMIATITSKRTR